MTKSLMNQDNLTFSVYDIQIDLRITNRKQLVVGDSGTGKTFLFSVLSRYMSDYEIRCYNSGYSDMQYFISEISERSGYLIVIDNADVILTKEMRIAIGKDNRNKYLIFGRNPGWLNLPPLSAKELSFSGNVLHLVNYGEERFRAMRNKKLPR